MALGVNLFESLLKNKAELLELPSKNFNLRVSHFFIALIAISPIGRILVLFPFPITVIVSSERLISFSFKFVSSLNLKPDE